MRALVAKLQMFLWNLLEGCLIAEIPVGRNL